MSIWWTRSETQRRCGCAFGGTVAITSRLDTIVVNRSPTDLKRKSAALFMESQTERLLMGRLRAARERGRSFPVLTAASVASPSSRSTSPFYNQRSRCF